MERRGDYSRVLFGTVLAKKSGEEAKPPPRPEASLRVSCREQPQSRSNFPQRWRSWHPRGQTESRPTGPSRRSAGRSSLSRLDGLLLQSRYTRRLLGESRQTKTCIRSLFHCSKRGRLSTHWSQLLCRERLIPPNSAMLMRSRCRKWRNTSLAPC